MKKEIFLVLGIFTSNIFGYFFTKNHHWEGIFLAGLIFALIMFILLFFIPESPSYLANQNKSTEAIKILKKIRQDIKDSEVFLKKFENKDHVKQKTVDLSKLTVLDISEQILPQYILEQQLKKPQLKTQ